MIIDKITQKFIDKPVNLQMGAGKLSQRWGCSKEDIYAAKLKARSVMSAALEFSQIPTATFSSPFFLGSIATDTGSTKTFESSKPLTPKELKDLSGADGINSFVSKTTDRLTPKGNWVYTIDIKFNNKNFYDKDELKSKLKELLPDIKAQTLPTVKTYSEKALMIMISDDHAGALNSDSMYGNVWNEATYTKRLMQIAEEVKKLGMKFEEVHVISLGDQMNGWNAQTTRGGHEVKSLSNKAQFDIYTGARTLFYNDLFTSGVAKEYHVHDIENSNHTGNDFSYMANQFLDMYLSAKFPQVKRKSYFLPVEYFDYGIHTIGLTHGKDQKLMVKAFPLKLDYRTDLFLFQYFDEKGISPNKREITLYKGDLHSYAMDKGRFGRYVNIPSIMGSTDWTEANFGNSSPGALLEIYQKDSKTVQHIPLWF